MLLCCAPCSPSIFKGAAPLACPLDRWRALHPRTYKPLHPLRHLSPALLSSPAGSVSHLPPDPVLQMNMGDARRKELEFFRASKDYAGLRNVGTTYLSSNLSERLINAVRRQLPNISTFVNKRCGTGGAGDTFKVSSH